MIKFHCFFTFFAFFLYFCLQHSLHLSVLLFNIFGSTQYYTTRVTFLCGNVSHQLKHNNINKFKNLLEWFDNLLHKYQD